MCAPLPSQEFVATLQKLDIGLTLPQIYELMRSFDEDGSATIDFAEFSTVSAPSYSVLALSLRSWGCVVVQRFTVVFSPSARPPSPARRSPVKRTPPEPTFGE